MSTTDIVTVDDALVEEVAKVVADARALEVITPEQAQAGVEFLATIADAKKRNENARVFLVKPLNDQVKKINDLFKGNVAPLDEADQLVRGKVLAFQQAEQERMAAEQARIDAERRAAEEAAEAERRRQAAEAAEAERNAAAVEAARQAQLREAANERAREISLMTDEELEKIAVGSESRSDVALAEQEMSARLAQREAEQAAADQRRRAEEAQQREIAAKSAPAALATRTELASTSGSASVRHEWKATIIDEALVPAEYKLVDVKKINAVVKAGVREIPGVKIEQVAGLAVRSGR